MNCSGALSRGTRTAQANRQIIWLLRTLPSHIRFLLHFVVVLFEALCDELFQLPALFIWQGVEVEVEGVRVGGLRLVFTHHIDETFELYCCQILDALTERLPLRVSHWDDGSGPNVLIWALVAREQASGGPDALRNVQDLL